MSSFDDRLFADLMQPSFRRRLNRYMEQVDDCLIIYTKPQDKLHENQRQWTYPTRNTLPKVHNGKP